MGARFGDIQGVIRSIVARGAGPDPEGARRRRARIGPAEMERTRGIGRGTFLGGISPFGGGEGGRRGAGLFGGGAPGRQQTFGG